MTDSPISLSDRLLFAVPKKGRLQQACLDLLSGSDIQFTRQNRQDIALALNLPLALIFLPAADIPTFVRKGRVDLGITGRDQVAEHEATNPSSASNGIEEVMDLEFGRCKLQVQVPQNSGIERPEQLIGADVSTSFTNLTEAYFRKLEAQNSGSNGTTNGEGRDMRTKIERLSGSVETACELQVAQGIVDLVGKPSYCVIFYC